MLWIRLKFSQSSCHIEVDVPNTVTTLNQTPIFELYVCALVWLQERIPERSVFERDWTMCSKYDNHSKSRGVHLKLRLGTT